MEIDLQEQQRNDEERKFSEEYRERFKLACKADPLSLEFAKTCSSAVALLARTVSTFQMVNEIYGALSNGHEDSIPESELEPIAKKVMESLSGLPSAQALMMLARLGASCAFTEYVHILKIEQSKH